MLVVVRSRGRATGQWTTGWAGAPGARAVTSLLAVGWSHRSFLIVVWGCEPWWPLGLHASLRADGWALPRGGASMGDGGSHVGHASVWWGHVEPRWWGPRVGSWGATDRVVGGHGWVVLLALVATG